jgi:hypothetical protein
MNPLYKPVAERCGHRCEYCLASQDLFNFPFEVEHIVPRSDGGSDDLSNLALACHSCNRIKGAARVGRDDATAMIAPLFNPRADRWDEHFRIDFDRAEIVGLTPSGRATAARLDMNSPRQIMARAVWIELRLYPPRRV